MYRNSNKYKILIAFVFIVNCLFAQNKKTDLFINTGFSLFKNQFFDFKWNKDQPHTSKALYLAIELQENRNLFKISFSKTYWLMMSPANWVHAFTAQASYDNISIIKSFQLKNKKKIAAGLGHSFIREESFVLSPPSRRIRNRPIFGGMFGTFAPIIPYTSKAVSFTVQYNFTKHLNVGIFANYNYKKYNNYIQLGLPFNNIQFQVFYKFIKEK